MTTPSLTVSTRSVRASPGRQFCEKRAASIPTSCSGFYDSKEMSGSEERLPLYKIVLAGDVGVGKTSIFRRYDTNTFFDRRDSTFGLDKLNKNVEVDGQKCKVCFIISSFFDKLDY